MALYAFDGTWNEEHDAGVYGENTNVVEFSKAYDGQRAVVQSDQGQPNEPTVRDDFYVSGVGTRYGKLGKFFGGAFGLGGKKRIQEGKAAVAAHFGEGDYAIDIIGFSRGAALALHFANALRAESFPDKDGNRRKAEVRFLGLFDVVAAFGVPINLGPLAFQRWNIGYKLSLPRTVKYCFHAVSLDERRQAFRVTRVDNAYQVWFRGVHSDVGGGNANFKLSNIALAWMLRKALRVGLPIDAAFADRLEVDAAAAIKPATDPLKNPFRELRKNDRVHYTVAPRPDCRNPPSECPIESKEDERTRILATEELTR